MTEQTSHNSANLDTVTKSRFGSIC